MMGLILSKFAFPSSRSPGRAEKCLFQYGSLHAFLVTQSGRCVLAFNEPDMNHDVGGSNISPARAAEIWKKDVQPLKKEGIRLGAPAIAGTENGKQWLTE